MLKKLNSENFRNEILDKKIALVDFYADWCGPCRMLSPVIDEIAEERPDISVGKVNVDDESALASEYGIMSIPALIVFENGKEKARLVGVRPKGEILAELK
ncbi:MAG: thioredoxin [Clostridia bacterium]|nr:thioredoxin [Clostridia bacterium]